MGVYETRLRAFIINLHMRSSAWEVGPQPDPRIPFLKGQGDFMRHSNASPSAAVLAAAVFLLAGAASAETATVTKERTTTTESTPSGSTHTTATTRTYSRSDSPDVVYKSIDTENRGYVLRTETERISGFGDAFDKADKNHSGRLTREEFNSAWTEYKSTK